MLLRYDREDIAAVAQDSGWDLDIFEKALRLLLLLEEVDVHPFLNGKLLLKGGTALNLYLLDIPRLSVDIDVNFIGVGDREEMLAERPELERAVSAVARAGDYDVSLSGDSHAGTKVYLHYTNLSGMRDRLEIDINYLFRVPLWEPEVRTSKELMPGLTVSFPLVHTYELVAGKVMAALNRTAPRDLYDLAQLDKCVGAADRIFRGLCIGLSIVLPHPIHAYTADRLARVDPGTLETEVGRFLRKDEKMDYDEILARASSFAVSLLNLSDDERRYVDAAGNGVLKPELLLPGDEAFCDRLRNHPAILWKIQNTREHMRSQKS